MNEKIKHVTVEEAVDSHLEKIEEAKKTKRLMAVVFFVDEGGILKMSRTTFGFPIQSFDESLKMLKINLDGEATPPEPEPLPAADFMNDIEESMNEETPKENDDEKSDPLD